MKSWLFWVLWIIDAIVASVLLYFFIDELGKGYITSLNVMLWIGILVGLGVIVGGSLLLRAMGQMAWGIALVCVLAVPALLFVLFFAVVLLSGERWN